MKHLIFLALPLIFLAACTSRPATESAKTTADSTGSATVLDTTESDTASAATTGTARITSLSLSPGFDWKQVKLGDALTAAKAPETERPFEEDASHVGYSVEFDNLESVDYQYFTEKNKVVGVRVDLYLNNPASVLNYQHDLVAYYNARYGPAQQTATTSTWTAPMGGTTGNATVTLKDVSKAKEYGLVLKIGNVPAAK